MKVRAKNYYLEKEILLIAFKRDDIFSPPPLIIIYSETTLLLTPWAIKIILFA